MRKRTGGRRGGALFGSAMMALALATACAAPVDIARARQQLAEHLRQCSERHGYDPEAASGLGPYALGAGERQWRECVYEGVEKFLVPNTRTPEVYRKAIAEDREMTESVAGGRMTRAQRRTRVQALLQGIEQQEEVNKIEIERQMGDLDRQMQGLKRQQESARMRELRGTIGPLAR